MWDFIKYCLYCLLLVISGAFGNNHKGITFKDIIVGIITMFVLLGLLIGILWLIGFIMKIIRKCRYTN